MAPSLRYAIFAALTLAAVTGAYLAGVTVGREQSKGAFGAVMASVQADLALNQVLRLLELESDLARGCSAETLAKLRFDLDSQTFVLASLYKEHKGTWVVEGIEKRQAALPAQLDQFRKQYDRWTEPKCTK
jgi:hypothetical protein